MASENGILPPRYLRPERIGLGAMGEVFRAEDSVLDRTVAIKLLAEQHAMDGSLRERFTREALAAARLSGEPSALTIFDVGEWNGRPFIVMEYLDGGSLHEADRPSTETALDWLAQAAEALDAAHRNGVVHRDVKPGNLLLGSDGRVRVGDFGVASAAGMASLTATGTIVGTAGYLSPEQARGEKATAASDRYALAVVAYELLTGKRPFESESVTGEAAAHLHAEVPPVSPALDPVFRRGLAKDPADRFSSASELVDALREAVEGGAAPTRVLAPPRRPERSSRVPLVAIVAAAVVLVAAGLAALIAGGGDNQRAVAKQPAPIAKPQPPPPPPPPSPPPPPPPPKAVDGVALTDQATQALKNGDYAGAVRLATAALGVLGDTGQTYEAYAEYDLGAALAALGRCDEALQHLDNSEAIQGKRHEIDEARRQCEHRPKHEKKPKD